ncbi:MAG: hypothetical protein KW793_01000 [Candidatus Doudnabacteria bacterium]|nr:hypothetical protein [Candidatus Doudnabacteria bacterium]
MRLNNYQKVSLWFMALLFVFWLVLWVSNITEGFYNYLYSFLFGLTPLVAGAVALKKARYWGGLKTAIGKAVFFIGLGIFLWGCGEFIWSYYNFVLNIPAPYPSIADLGFAPSIFFYGLGAFYLSKVTGAKFALRNNFVKVGVVVATILITVLAYYFLVDVARGGSIMLDTHHVVKMILDLAYPIGDYLALMIAAIISGLSFKYLGGAYRKDIIAILLGLGVMFVADTVFSYTTTVGTYYNANFGDLLLTLGTFLLSFGVLGFCKSAQES